MRLVIFIQSLSGGGAERVAATLGSYWARKQWEVTIVTLESQSLDFYALDGNIKRISLNLSGDSGHVVEALWQNVRRVMALRRIIKQLRPDVVLSMMSASNVLLAFATIGMRDVCAIGSEHCYPPHVPLGAIWHALRQRMYGQLAAVTALTEKGGEWVRTHSSARTVPVIPNPVCWPLAATSPRVDPAALFTSERRILLAVGRLSQEKNFDVLIEVFSKLAPMHPGWDLVILGDGPERSLLEAKIRSASLDGRVYLPGIVGNVGEWYARAELFAMSSRFEGFPNALAEALAHGLPAVSFDCDTGPRDIIRHGVDGLLVPAGSAFELHAALDRVMNDNDLRAKLASHAIEARGRFSIEKVAGAWEDLFSKLADIRVESEIAGAGQANRGYRS